MLGGVDGLDHTHLPFHHLIHEPSQHNLNAFDVLLLLEFSSKEAPVPKIHRARIISAMVQQLYRPIFLSAITKKSNLKIYKRKYNFSNKFGRTWNR